MRVLKLMVASLALIAVSPVATAQALYKYTDKDGKVTYSDKAPKPGEKAELVKSDSNVNVMTAPSNKVDGVKQSLQDVNARAAARAALRDKMKADVDAARSQLEQAKKALEDGREAAPEERQIVVRKDGNSVLRKPEYYDRIAALEAAVKQAEENLAKAEEKFNRDAPG
ncbi:MAG TPA: DUF4124 domain-containing protein [Usitatibacteraceae bacterium]